MENDPLSDIPDLDDDEIPENENENENENKNNENENGNQNQNETDNNPFNEQKIEEPIANDESSGSGSTSESFSSSNSQENEDIEQDILQTQKTSNNNNSNKNNNDNKNNNSVNTYDIIDMCPKNNKKENPKQRNDLTNHSIEFNQSEQIKVPPIKFIDIDLIQQFTGERPKSLSMDLGSQFHQKIANLESFINDVSDKQ